MLAPAVDDDRTLRTRISAAVCDALEPLPEVLAGWEGGSAAFDALDQYSDIDLNVLVVDTADVDSLFRLAEQALTILSPIIGSHASPPGRYYQLRDAGEFLLVDLIILRTDAAEQCLGTERHGKAVPLFDKGTWLMAELLRMRYCPVRWDFGVRYLDRDLPADAYSRFRDLTFVRDLDDLEAKLAAASAWGAALLLELEDQYPALVPQVVLTHRVDASFDARRADQAVAPDIKRRTTHGHS